MQGEHIRQLLEADPFQPFTLGLMGRTRVRVARPDLAQVSPDGHTLKVLDALGSCSIISIGHIATITFDPPPPDPDVVVEN